MDKFTIDITKNNDHTVIKISGMADMLIAERLDKAFNEAIESQNTHLIVDMSDLHFICSICLSSLIKAHRKCTETDNKLILTDVPVMIQKLLQTTQLDSLFVLCENMDDACRYLNGDA